MSVHVQRFVPNDDQKLALLRGMILTSTGQYPNDKLVLPPVMLIPSGEAWHRDYPDANTLVDQGDGGSWDEDADDDDD